MSLKQKLFLAGIILLAVFFRYYQIIQMPGGLFPDEAANGLDINLMQAGHLQPFYERGNGREALFFYMEWASVAVFGKGPWQHHVVSALIGVLSVLMCFLVTRKIFLMDNVGAGFSRPGSGNKQLSSEAGGHRPAPTIDALKNRATNIALLAAFLMTVSTWHIVLSRTAFRAILIPLFTSLVFYFLISAYQAKAGKKQLLYAFLTGASFALGFYSYIVFRIMVPILFVLLAWPLFPKIRERQFWRTIINYKLLIISFLVAFAIVIFPLAKYFNQHPGSFIGRAGQVSIFNPDLYTYDGVQFTGKPPLGIVAPVLIEVVKTQLLGFFTHGDLNWRSNISGYPFLSPLYSPFFGVGLIIITWLALRYFFTPGRKSHYWKYFLLAVWLWGMLLPVAATAEGIPHGLRGIGMIPAVFIISAWVLYEFGLIIVKLHKKLWQHALYHYKDPQWMKNHHFVPPRMRLVNIGLKLIVVCFCLALISQTYFLYFVYAANSPENFYFFRSDLTTVSNYLVERCNKQHTYLVLDEFWLQTTDYLTSDWHGNFQSPCNIPYQKVQPENAYQLSNLTSQDEVIFTQSTMFDARKFKQYHPTFRLREEIRNKFGQSVLAVYKINF